MKQEKRIFTLELANHETLEYLKKDYNLPYPWSEEDTNVALADFNKAWDNGERTPVDNWEELKADMAEDCDE